MTTPQFIVPEWPAPSRILAASTQRHGGVSTGPYSNLNLGLHVGDDPAAVRVNRERIKATLRLPAEPCWLNQVHGSTVIEAHHADAPPNADASVAHSAGQVCAILTADCLPVLFCSKTGDRVGAAHAGWRGLAAGVLEAMVASLQLPGEQLLVWLGPAISQQAFEVGDDVRIAFLKRDTTAASAFARNARGRWQADLYSLARLILARLGVSAVYGGEQCCYTQQDDFFSFRRDGQTGRMATLIWIDPALGR